MMGVSHLCTATWGERVVVCCTPRKSQFLCVVGFMVVLLRAIGSCAYASIACTSVRHARRKDMRTSSACLLHSLNDVAGGTWAKLDVCCARCARFFSVMRSIVHDILGARCHLGQSYVHGPPSGSWGSGTWAVGTWATSWARGHSMYRYWCLCNSALWGRRDATDGDASGRRTERRGRSDLAPVCKDF